MTQLAQVALECNGVCHAIFILRHHLQLVSNGFVFNIIFTGYKNPSYKHLLCALQGMHRAGAVATDGAGSFAGQQFGQLWGAETPKRKTRNRKGTKESSTQQELCAR